jgi:hypothetical protein
MVVEVGLGFRNKNEGRVSRKVIPDPGLSSYCNLE